ncbi:hypothetical protein Tco_1204043 [Tanacetum coccineum]
MAQLKYCDKHNQVGFLRKPNESAGFAEIVDFLRGSNLRYALTANPTISDSLVKQFWQSAIATTRADGSLEINATIDTIRKGLKRQKEAKTIKNRQETRKRQRVKSKTKNSARNHSRISPTQSNSVKERNKESQKPNYKSRGQECQVCKVSSVNLKF